MILAPILRKRTETADESNATVESHTVAGFRAVYVWDEQQGGRCTYLRYVLAAALVLPTQGSLS